MSSKRQLRLRAQRRSPTDLRKLSRALIDLAQAQAEADAQAEHQSRPSKPPSKQRRKDVPR
jgi:hypothetical protein